MSATLVTELQRLADALGGEAERPIFLATVAKRMANARDENRPEIENNFSEHVSRQRFEGVLQISRKGTTLRAAGPDFTQEELGKVPALCHPLGKLLPHFAAA